MATQMTPPGRIRQIPIHVTSQWHEAEARGGLSKRYPHCIINKLQKDTVRSILENISEKPIPPESSIYKISPDWIESLSSLIAGELSKGFNAPPNNFSERSKEVANIISGVGNGTWSPGITPVNAIRDVETNLPLYISDYFDQLSGWSREHVFDQEKLRIGSDLSGSTSQGHHGPESALSDRYVKIGWNLPAVNAGFSFKTSSNTPAFSVGGEPSSGEVYRYFAFIDSNKQAVSLSEDGSVIKELYNFTDPAQLWRIDNYGKSYALHNKKYNAYLGKNARASREPDKSIYIVENNSFTYSIGHVHNNSFHEILTDLTLVTVPLVAWRNSSGHFLNLGDNHGALNFSSGERHGSTTIPKSEQLFLFVPHPDFSKKAVIVGQNKKFFEFNPSSGKVSSSYDLKNPARLPFALFDYDQNIWPRSTNFLASRLEQPLIAQAAPPPGKGTRVRVWKSDPSVRSVGIRELFLLNPIETGPSDSLFETSSTTGPIEPDQNGDILLDFEDTPSRAPESDNHVQFDVVHVFSIVRYTYDLLLGDLEYLDGSPPQLNPPWGNRKLVLHPHAGKQANAYYSRSEGVLKFFYTDSQKEPGKPIYLCRSLDIVSHETGHSFLDNLQPGWYGADGQTGGFHEAFGDLCSLFVLISMAEIADLFITLTKANLRDPDNFLSAVGEEFGEAIQRQGGKGLRNLSNNIKGSQAEAEVHQVSLVFSGFLYDVLVDVFSSERNPSIKSDTETLMDVATNLRRALIIAIRVSSSGPSATKFQEIATNLETSLGTLGRRLGVNLASWQQIVRRNATARELSIAGRG